MQLLCSRGHVGGRAESAAAGKPPLGSPAPNSSPGGKAGTRVVVSAGQTPGLSCSVSRGWVQ
ncbi:hypothetical protein N7530_001985 [Penicillium desertorum]|uniref:Uncharacterized protein n=1 Tax=Penicillium desertorum TaxID=1303715 RepID=A0A9W9XBA9_9EURO|nr:hypothetical protein N7530_001985 [Penicillium desertorum]